MATLAEMKAMSPAYAALSDQEFADKVYQKHYAGKIDRAEFDKRTAPVSVTKDVVGQAAQGFNKGIDALVALSFVFGFEVDAETKMVTFPAA